MNAEAANKLFTLYLAGKRAERVGYNKLNFSKTESEIRSAVTQIEGNKELLGVFEKARTQYNNYNRNLMKFMESTGAMSKDVAEQLASTNFDLCGCCGLCVISHGASLCQEFELV